MCVCETDGGFLSGFLDGLQRLGLPSRTHRRTEFMANVNLIPGDPGDEEAQRGTSCRTGGEGSPAHPRCCSFARKGSPCQPSLPAAVRPLLLSAVLLPRKRRRTSPAAFQGCPPGDPPSLRGTAVNARTGLKIPFPLRKSRTRRGRRT